MGKSLGYIRKLNIKTLCKKLTSNKKCTSFISFHVSTCIYSFHWIISYNWAILRFTTSAKSWVFLIFLGINVSDFLSTHFTDLYHGHSYHIYNSLPTKCKLLIGRFILEITGYGSTTSTCILTQWIWFNYFV